MSIHKLGKYLFSFMRAQHVLSYHEYKYHVFNDENIFRLRILFYFASDSDPTRTRYDRFDNIKSWI